MTESTQPRFQPTLHSMFFMLGYGLHHSTYHLVQSQVAIDILSRLSLVLFAIGLPLAWSAGKRAWVYFWGVWVLYAAVMGPSEPRPYTTASAIADAFLLTLFAFGFFMNLIGLLKQRRVNAAPR